MSNESQIQILSAVLIVLCLVLLWCWYNKKNKHASVVDYSRSGFSGNYYDKIAYAAPARPVGFKTKGLNDIVNKGVRHTHVMKKALQHDNVKAKWMTDGQIHSDGSKAIQTDGFLAKYASDSDGDMYGSVRLPAEVVTPDKPVVPMRSGSLSGDMIRLTEFEPIYGNSSGKISI